jgi:peptide/nickel transport system substrate-binding protein
VLSCALAQNLRITNREVGRPGGRLVVAQRAEPKTFNPVTAIDAPSREVIRRLMADLISVDRQTQQTVPSLARRWSVSPDGCQYTLELRRGVRFSDGYPFDADDVVFTFQVYLDQRVGSPQRDLLLVGGRPITVEKVDSHTVRFRLAQPYAAAERLFDSIAILPRHLLRKAYDGGKFAGAWSLSTPPAAMAGLGPFRLKEFVPGRRVVLQRNPYYWKTDREGIRLPYLDELVFVAVLDEDTQVIRFLSGETDILNRVGARNFSALSKNPRAGDRSLEDLCSVLE